MQFLYLILSLFFGRKNPLYYLIFPIALVSGPGAFIDPRTVLFGGDIFLLGKNMYKDVIVIYLFLVVLFLHRKIKMNVVFKTLMKLYALYIFIVMILTVIHTGFNYEAFNVMRLFIDMILGYYLLIMIFSSISYKQFVSFFNMLFWSTATLSVFYVLNSSGKFPLYYQKTLYQDVDFGNSTFFRDFSTIPYFSHLLFIFAVAIFLLKNKDFNRNAVSFILVTYPFVLLFTFTRSLLSATIIEIILMFLILTIRNPRIIFKKSILVLIGMSLILWVILQLSFSNQLGYFSSRVDSAKSEGVNEGNVAIRVAYHYEAFSILNNNKSLLVGVGMNKKNDSDMDFLGAWQADSTIPFLLLKTGIVGVLFFYLMNLSFLFRLRWQLKNNFNPISLALTVFILFTTLSSLIMGGYRWGDPFIFFPFVLVVTIENYIKKGKLSIMRSQAIKYKSERVNPGIN